MEGSPVWSRTVVLPAASAPSMTAKTSSSVMDAES